MASNREEFLDDDNEIPGQRFCLLSFLSPEKVLASKDQFFFKRFLDSYEIQWKTKNLEKFLAEQVIAFNAKLDTEANRLSEANLAEAAELCRTSRIRVDDILGAQQAFVKENAKEITDTKIKDAYEDFLFANEKKLEDEFFAKNNFTTTVRGLKVRGSQGTQEEATARAKKLQRNDPIHNIYVAETGKWLAWDPSPNSVQNQEYQNDQLNSLMKAYQDNEEKREQFQQQNPELKDGGKRSGKGLKDKEILSVVTDSATASAGTAEEVAGAGAAAAGGQFGGLFDGPADLALQRKLEREGKKE